jgi:hypothetical protein
VLRIGLLVLWKVIPELIVLETKNGHFAKNGLMYVAESTTFSS